MSSLMKQRIKYLVEEGGLYPRVEPTTRSLLLKAVVVVILLQLLDIVIQLLA